MPETNYADDCRIFTPENPDSQYANIYFAVFDVHFIAHFLGWLGKMLIMRDWYVAWICSAGFEFLELTFRHWLPNFYECWWDSLLLDLFGCNLLGIVAGSFILKYFSVSKIDWLRGKEVKATQTEAQPTVSCDNMVINVINKLRPAALERYEWSGLQSLERYVGLTMFIIVCLLIDCNNFFYKYLVWVPADHDLLKFRIFLWGFAAIATSKEWYEYVSNPHCHRLGPFAWLTFYVSLIELSSVMKF
jgi:phosphatidylserine synthase 2